MSTENLILLAPGRIIYYRVEMIALMCLCLRLFPLPFKSKIPVEVENAILRHQLIVLQRKIHGRVRFTNSDRLFFIWFPPTLDNLRIIRPETLERWLRVGFRCYWRWKPRSGGGRPRIDAELRALIQRMSVDNPLRGAAEEVGFEVPQSSVAKYMIRRSTSRSAIEIGSTAPS